MGKKHELRDTFKLLFHKLRYMPDKYRIEMKYDSDGIPITLTSESDDISAIEEVYSNIISCGPSELKFAVYENGKRLSRDELRSSFNKEWPKPLRPEI